MHMFPIKLQTWFKYTVTAVKQVVNELSDKALLQ